MSQPIQLTGLNTLMGQGPKGEISSEELGEMLEAMELEGHSFADLLNSEFAQFLDAEQLQAVQKNPELLEGIKDNVLPLLALMGGKELPLQQIAGGNNPVLGLSDKEALMQKLQQVLKAGNGLDSQAKADSGLDELKSMLSLKGGEESESSEEFLKQLEMLAGKRVSTAALTQQALQANAAEPMVVNTGLSTQPSSQSTLQPVPVSQPVQTPPGQPNWDAQVGQRLIWMVSNEMKSAEIKLNPADLGPMEVKVKTEGEKVSLVFNVQNPQVREAIEQSLPRLREIFAGQGMDLGDVDVGQHGFAQDQGREEAEQLDAQLAGRGQEGDAEPVDEIDAQEHISGQGMVDYYI